MNRVIIMFLGFISFHCSFAQQRQGVLDYIERYKKIAIDEMVRCGIPASITLAQGIHESNCGQSPLSREANNHFGIKCKAEWEGKKYYLDDDAPDECFRVYEHAEASYADHSDFLVTRSRYADLFQLRITDYAGWAHGLKAAGYATNPKYAQILIKQIEDYNLQQFDQAGLALIREKGKPSSYPYSPPAATASTPKETPKPDVEKKEVESAPIAFMGSVENEAPVSTHESNRKEYSVNGLRTLLATANEDPLKIAMDYQLDFLLVMQYNDLTTGEHFKEGEYIFLQPKKSKSSEKTYQVNKGESMRDVAQKFGIRLRDLYSKNLMKPNDQPRAGETLFLRDKRKAPPQTVTYAQFLKAKNPVRSATPKKLNTSDAAYQVQPSDTLFSIARKFNMSVEELKALNNLDSVTIREGQHLVVSK